MAASGGEAVCAAGMEGRRDAAEELVSVHARCHAAESRARVLERQLQAAVEVIDTIELQSGDTGSGLRGQIHRLAAAALNAPSAEQLRLCSQLAAAHAENQRLSSELECERQRSSAVLQSSLESAAHARSTMELQQGMVVEARVAYADELRRMEERLAASEALRAKAAAEVSAKEQNVRRLMALVQQHEQRHAADQEAAEKADLERLKMQRTLREMADQLDQLQARADAAAVAQAVEAAKLAKATLPHRGGPKRAVLARRQQQPPKAPKAPQSTPGYKGTGARGRGS